jgi:simple sugar transport system ATP-binding protein
MLTAAEFPGRGRFLLRPGLVARTAAALAERAAFPLPAARRVLETLSGGNVQRVVLAREMNDHARYLLAFYPSRGLDVASTRAVQQQLVSMRDRGCAVLLVSEDLDELTALCDRILVFHAGQVVGEFGRHDLDRLRVGRLMTGAEEAA